MGRRVIKADTPRFLYLQYLRGAAALLVVYFHAVIRSTHELGPGLPLPIIGAAGVDIFFVLSGFVISISIAARPLAPAEFFRRRLIRIVPLYWTCTSAVVLIALVMPHWLRATVLDPLHVLASYLFIPWHNPAAIAGIAGVDLLSPVLVPGWTLNYEMLFYTVFAWAMLFTPEHRTMLIVVTLSAISLSCFLARNYVPAAAFYSPAHLFEFVAGLLLAERFRMGGFRFGVMAWLIVIAGSVGCLVFLEYNPSLSAPDAAGFILAVAAAAIVATAVSLESHGKLLVSEIGRRLGDASYAIYLTHVFVVAILAVVLRYASPVLGPEGGAALQFCYVLACIVLSSAVGLCIHRWFDMPAMRFLERWSSRRALATQSEVTRRRLSANVEQQADGENR